MWGQSRCSWRVISQAAWTETDEERSIYTCYGQTNRSINSFAQASQIKGITLTIWESIWENPQGIFWSEMTMPMFQEFGCDKWRAPCDYGHCPLVTYLALSPPATAPSPQSPLSLSLKGTILPLNTKFYHKNTLVLTHHGVAWLRVAFPISLPIR